MSQIHIFGLNHFHQNLEPGCLTPAAIADEQQQKAGLRATLCEIIAKNRVELIAEEARLDRPCLGRILAEEHGIDYANITMPIEEREKHGVGTPEYNREQATRMAAYKAFEQYMFGRARAHGSRAILIMCGRRHFRALEKLFKDAGDDVRTYDINDYPWYRGRPIEEAEGVTGYDKEE